MYYAIITLAVAIIAGLTLYAGYLLYQLYRQTQRQRAARQSRIDKITESIQTIALAVSQQQCDLSEGSIRLCILLDAIPILPQPDYRGSYPALHALYDKVKDMPTHEARKQQDKREKLKMDLQRGEWEAELESAILDEVKRLSHFSV